MLSYDKNWIGFHVVACSSEEYGTSSELIAIQPYASQKSWESSRTATFPQEIILRFYTRIEIDHVILSSKPDKYIPEIEFHIGDGLSGSFLDVDYRLSGNGGNIIDKFSQMKLQGIGTYLKLIFPKGPLRSKHNPYGQVSIGGFKIWGRPTNHLLKLKNEANPITNDKSQVDKILIGMGMPVDLIAWFDEDDRNFEYAPIDEDSRQTLIDMQKLREKALREEDYEAMKQLSVDIKKVFDLGREIWQLMKDLEFAVAQEDFKKAIDLKEKIRKLAAKRDTYDALYETSRWENMIIMQRPTTAQQLADQQMLDEENRRNAELLRRQRELEELERRRLLEEENRKKPKDVDMTPFWEKGLGVDVGKQQKKKPMKEKDDLDVGFKNIFNYNQGDVDLELYFKPLIAHAGEAVKEVGIEILRRLNHLGYLTIFGARIWTAIFNENWRVREAAAQAVLNFIEMPLLPKYLDGKSKKLFLASMEMARIACEDKLLQIYFIGLKILSTALAPPVCGTDVSPQLINKVLKEFIPIMIVKISELNYRARDISLHTLISLFRHPAAQIGNLVVGCMDLIDIEDDIKPKRNGPIDKQQWRLVLARLEIVLHVLQEFGYDQNEWNWEPVFRHLITPSLFHSNVDVRLIAVELCVTLYQLLGQEIRIAVNNIDNLKPNLLGQINQRMDEVEETAMKNQAENADKQQNGLSRVDEANEEDNEQTPNNRMQKRQTSIMLNGRTTQPYQADDIKNSINSAMEDPNTLNKNSNGNLAANKNLNNKLSNNTQSTQNLQQQQKPQSQVSGQQPQTQMMGQQPQSQMGGQQPQTQTVGQKPNSQMSGQQPQAQTMGQQSQSQMSGQPQMQAMGQQPQSQMGGQQPQMQAMGQQPQSQIGGKQPQTQTMGQQSQSQMNGQQPQMQAMGQQPQSQMSGQQPQMQAMGQQPQSQMSGQSSQPNNLQQHNSQNIGQQQPQINQQSQQNMPINSNQQSTTNLQNAPSSGSQAQAQPNNQQNAGSKPATAAQPKKKGFFGR